MDEIAIYLNSFQWKKMANLSLYYSPIGILYTFSAAANQSREVGEVRVGQSVAFLTAAAVLLNELVNSIT